MSLTLDATNSSEKPIILGVQVMRICAFLRMYMRSRRHEAGGGGASNAYLCVSSYVLELLLLLRMYMRLSLLSVSTHVRGVCVSMSCEAGTGSLYLTGDVLKHLSADDDHDAVLNLD